MRWEGHGNSICLPCAVTARPSNLAVCDLFPRPHKCATPKRRRSFWRRSFRGRSLRWWSRWWALFRQTHRRDPHRRALRLAALRVRKTLCPACGIRRTVYLRYAAPSGVTPVELRHASPRAIHSADSTNSSLVSAANWSSSFHFFPCAHSSSWFLPQPFSVRFFLRMLLQRHNSSMFL